MGRAFGAPMHPMAFLQKRGHLCAVARGREMFARVDAEMTPARFDILYLIHRKVIIEQAGIPHALGLRRQTVWKMIERLVELGIVRKTKDVNGPDERRNLLSLTEEGRRRVRRAHGIAFSERVVLPKDAPSESEGDVPRYWRRPELADVRYDPCGKPIPPKKEGREVAKVYTSFAWKHTSDRLPDRRYRYLAVLDNMMMSSLSLARALGDRSTPIYPIVEPELTAEPRYIKDAERQAAAWRRRGWCEVGSVIVGGPRILPPLMVTTTGPCRVRPQRRRRCPRPSERRCPIARDVSTSCACSA